MKEYTTKCPGCLLQIPLKMDNRDERRNTDEFFKVGCPYCKRKWFAKIIETLVIYPYKLSL